MQIENSQVPLGSPQYRVQKFGHGCKKATNPIHVLQLEVRCPTGTCSSN